MSLLLFKALHIIGFVAWFAGLFYLVRLFVYHIEAKDKPQPEQDILIRQYVVMEKRLFQIIVHPAMIFTVICGVTMLVLEPGYLKMGWMHLKLAFLVALIGYHFFCGKVIQKLEKGEMPYTSSQFRMLNEVPTLLLIPIVLLAVFKNLANVAYIFLTIIVLGISFYFIIKWYKKYREAK